MKKIFVGLIALTMLFACHRLKKYSEKEVLNEFDLAFKGEPGNYFPLAFGTDIRYNFFPDLEHGYFVTAGNRIHLYRDSTRWAFVFEKNGYENRGERAGIELDYIGNCINYPVEVYGKYKYITNSDNIALVTSQEYERITNRCDTGMQQFELVSPDAKDVVFHGTRIPIEQDSTRYIKLGILPRPFDNPHSLVGYDGLVRYVNETNPALAAATEKEIRKHLPKDLPKLMTIDKYHFQSFYHKDTLPSQQETYQLIAKILATGDTTLWKPRLKANNDWRNWESGNL